MAQEQEHWAAAVARNIRRLRDVRGWSARELAEACADLGLPGLDRWVLANIESGRRRSVSVDELLGLAAALSVSPAALLLPEDPDAELEVTPGWEARAVEVLEWIRGSQPLGGMEERYFLDSFAEAYTVSYTAKLETSRRQAEALLALAGASRSLRTTADVLAQIPDDEACAATLHDAGVALEELIERLDRVDQALADIVDEYAAVVGVHGREPQRRPLQRGRLRDHVDRRRTEANDPGDQP